MTGGELDREILRGRVFDEPLRAERAAQRADRIVEDLRQRDIVIRAGWWGPAGVTVIVGALQLLRGASTASLSVWVTLALLLNAGAYIARRRQLERAVASLEGNRDVARSSAGRGDDA